MAETIHIVSIVVFFVCGLVASYQPVYFAKKAEFMSYMNIFAAGVFLAVGLMTILPGSAKDLHSVQQDIYEFPLAYFLAVIGFLFIFACEEVVHTYYRKTFGRSSHDEPLPIDIETTPRGPYETVQEDGKPLKLGNEDRSIAIQEDQLEGQEDPGHTSVRAAIVLLVALSIHELLEGFAVGALDDPTWGLFFALLIHKYVESFALGAAFVRAKTPTPFFLLIIFLYGLTLPLGIGIGMATAASDSNVGTGVVLALSAGSFIFIATVEVIPAEFSEKYQKGRWIRYLCLVSGFLLMALLIFFEEYAEHKSGAESSE